jgi:ATP-binding cassette subfamily F protein uup
MSEYAGGYTAMAAQRGAGFDSAGAPSRVEPAGRRRTAAPAASGEAKRAQPKRKLSFREKHDLEALPAEIEALAREAERLEQRLADPALFSSDPDAFTRASAALEKVRARQRAAEERWLALELLREELEAS